MDTNTSDGKGRKALWVAALVLGPILAYIVHYGCFFYQLSADFTLFGQTGERAQEVDSFGRVASALWLVLWVMIPVGTALGALAMITRIRRWVGPLAAVVGIFTGFLLVVEVVVTAVYSYLSRSI